MDRKNRNIKAANKGVNRNKKPLPNILLFFEIFVPKDEWLTEFSEKYNSEEFLFKDIGYIKLSTRSQKSSSLRNYYHGLVSIVAVKSLLSVNQWSKFCQGERFFIVQRRFDGKKLEIN